MKKNAGFTLIEAIVTVAIMAVLTAGTVTVLLSQSGTRCRKAAELLNTGLAETKSQALAKKSAWAQICYDANDGYILKRSFAGDVELGEDFEITYDVYKGDDPVEEDKPLTAGSLLISYDRASGSLMGLMESVDTDSLTQEETVTKKDGTTTKFLGGYDLSSVASPELYCKRIKVAKGTRYVYVIEFDRVTGKHAMSKQ